MTTMKTAYPELLWPFKNLPQNYVVLDLETTGLIDDIGAPSILAIGIVEVNDGQPVNGTEMFARPSRPITQEAAAIHGITENKAANFPALEDSWGTLSSLLHGRLVVIHNAAFDWVVISEAGRIHQLQLPSVQGIFCSQRSAHPWAQAIGMDVSDRGPSLDSLTKQLELRDRRSERAGYHGALIDAQQTVAVVECLRERGQQKHATPAE